jgi:hypothetical protein
MNQAIQNMPAPGPTLPLFYKNPVPVEAGRHATAGLREHIDFGFSRETNAIALTASEIVHAARHYPVVFSKESPVPFAVVGLRDKENLFVDADGKWRDGHYIPAYVRRYPFIFSEVQDSQQLVLCVDEASDHFEASSSVPFFVDGKPSESLQRSLKFNETFQMHYEDTRRFGEWLEKNDMLEGKLARAELGNGQTLTLQGFRLLNPERLRALDDAQVLELHKRGWLPLMHFHLQSLQNWALLSSLARVR